MFKKILLLLMISLSTVSFSQNSLLNKLHEKNNHKKSEVSSIFKSYKLVNFETTKLVSKGDLNFIVAHRFGTIKNGIEDLFGLDQASTRLQFVYGLTDGINLSFSRSKFGQTYDFGTKYKIINQSKNGSRVSIAGHHLLAINTQLDDTFLPGLEFENRLHSAHQLLIASKINNRLSVELIPTISHDGLVKDSNQENWQYALGFGGRYLITKRMGIIADYGWHLNRSSTSLFNNPLSVGIEIETGGHVFQLHFSNAQGMFENAYLNQASGDWSEGDIFFGFNINRNFNLGSKKRR